MKKQYSVQEFMRHFEEFGRFPHPIRGGEGEGGDEGKQSEQKTNEQSQSEAKNDDKTPKTFTQDDVDRIVGERLKRERTSIRDSVLKELKDKKDEDERIARGEFDKVLAAKDEEISRLTGLQETIDEYERLAKERQEKAVKELPDTIKLLMPDNLTPLEFEKWFSTKATPALAKLGARRGNNPRDPDGTKRDEMEILMENQLKKMQQSGAYRL